MLFFICGACAQPLSEQNIDFGIKIIVKELCVISMMKMSDTFCFPFSIFNSAV